MKIKYAVALCGKICSGKSSIAQILADQFSYCIVSFGDIVRQKVMELQLPPSREVCQRIGYELFTLMGARQLLRTAINISPIPSLNKVVFDGVRHESLLGEIRNISDNLMVIYMETGEMVRYLRYKERDHDAIHMSLNEFRAIDRHPIEQGIENWAHHAAIIIDGTSGLPDNNLGKLIELLKVTGA